MRFGLAQRAFEEILDGLTRGEYALDGLAAETSSCVAMRLHAFHYAPVSAEYLTPVSFSERSQSSEATASSRALRGTGTSAGRPFA